MRLEQEARVDRMTAIERVETVPRGEIPDRVPVDLHDFMVAAYASGRPSRSTSGMARPWQRARSPLAPGGGLILGPGCALPPETPPENLHALVEAAHRWGRYSPDGSLVE